MKTSIRTAQKNLNPKVLLVVLLAILVGLGACAAYSRLRQYQTLANTFNHACLGLDTARRQGLAAADTYAFARLGDRSSKDIKTVHHCLIGKTTKDATIHGKHIPSYGLGAQVTYFKSAEAAKAHAEKQVNPLRFWGVDEEGQRQNIPQSSLFTFVVTDAKPIYFDAYTVRDNALFRISLPCKFENVKAGDVIDACFSKSQTILEGFAKAVKARDF